MSRLRMSLSAALLLSVFGLSVYLLLRLSPQPAAVAAIPPALPVPPPLEHYVGQLPGGVKVVLVGLAPMESDPQHWWKPDGRPLSPIPVLQPNELGLISITGAEMRRVLVQVHGVPDAQWVRTNMTGSVTDQKLPSGESYVSIVGGLPVPPGKSVGTVEIRVASEPLSPTRYLDAQGQRIPAAADAPPDPIPEDIQVTRVTQKNVITPQAGGGTVPQVQTELVYLIPTHWRQIDLHIVVIDTMGKSHHEVGSSYSFSDNTKSPGMRTCTFDFPLPPAQIDRFEYQFRLFRHWATFENISLQPDRLTNVKITVDSDSQ